MILRDDYGRTYRVTNNDEYAWASTIAWTLALWTCVALFVLTRATFRLTLRGFRALRARRANRLAHHRAILAEHNSPPVWR